MQLQIFAVFDHAVGAFTQPFYARTKNEAVRSFMGAVNGENSQFAKSAKDYALFYLGEFDDNQGSFAAPQQPERLMTAEAAVQAQLTS